MIGEKIQQLVKDETREKQYKMFELCDLLDLSLPTLHRLFKRKSVETDILIKLCQLYNVKLNYFFEDSTLFENADDTNSTYAIEPSRLPFLIGKAGSSENLHEDKKPNNIDKKHQTVEIPVPSKRIQEYLVEIRSLEIEIFHLKQSLKDKQAVIDDKNTIIQLLNQLIIKLKSGNDS